DSIPFLPAEIRRYRPDLGMMHWETVLDTRDIDGSGPFETNGFRQLLPYHAEADGVLYLYAGSFGADASLWRSRTGGPGDWEKTFSSGEPGSIRAMAVHNGILYFATTILDLLEDDESFGSAKGVIYGTDGATVWTVIEGGFGNEENLETIVLHSFNGWLYAGTRNRAQGYEVWKFAGPGMPVETAVPIVTAGGPDSRNESAGTMLIFQEKLYVGSLIFGGLISGFRNAKGADLIRINTDDTWDTVVGTGSVGGVESGFGSKRNAYLWSLEEHDGMLYAGTWDDSIVIVGGLANADDFIRGEFDRDNLEGIDNNPLNPLFKVGGDLYRSADGVHWDLVFNNGLGNPNNYGVRTMESAGGDLYLGFANPTDGLDIWRSIP
ncbi:MAG: hypothetical protein WD873_06340, partial [Candidatus Hydrogenedentales bacterium]